ncbi:cytochrome c biogenesis heme-transporting ATPase CcmA [Candidatus Berkiella aquae]|uniref:Cytochrome c biogenesis ATP-binding export protein CcmA n=1 Tax=Candidatus Berkiella aquae TaxID=295108 RepID=A0A0Q9YL54_9GAMM|nr:cytochrome c biogenesis heme-transporting ATPase CcmA [Candidatus Berkiella aquae]MCS5711401.1 cytochrome c biogenesis heme-transporting ATPase CcmA [Candidatus Berkiella aquae]
MTLVIKNLSQSKGQSTLFRHLCFALEKGRQVLVQGANGAGKSTLLKIIAGLQSPDKGEITWQGHPLFSDKAQYFSHMSYLGHQNGLKRSLTPRENIEELLCLANANATCEKIERVFEDFALTEHANQRCETLSAGECRKVALAAVILKNKPLWLLDEPFNSLDKASYQRMQTSCQQHLASGGMIILSTHQGSHHYDNSQIICLS